MGVGKSDIMGVGKSDITGIGKSDITSSVTTVRELDFSVLLMRKYEGKVCITEIVFVGVFLRGGGCSDSVF